MIIVHVENYFDPKAGYQINELLYASKDFNDNVYLITSKDMSRFHKQYDPKFDKEFEEKTGVTIIRLDSIFKISSRIVLKNLNNEIEILNPDLLFMHGIGDFRDLYLLKRKKPYKIVRDCHMSWVASQNKFKSIYYWFFKSVFSRIINKTNKYEKVFALGVEEHDYLKKIGIHENKIELMLHGYNGDVMYYSEMERNEVRSYYGFIENDIIISYIGKFNNFKRPDLIFDILNLLDASFLEKNRIKLLFIGPKNEDYMDLFNGKLEKLESNIDIIIEDAKPFDELRKYYSCSDICIFPKQTSLSSIHAQVCHCPVIMEEHDSNKERVIDNKNLYPIDDLHAASSIIKRLIISKQYVKNENIYKEIEKREYRNQIMQLHKIING